MLQAFTLTGEVRLGGLSGFVFFWLILLGSVRAMRCCERDLEKEWD